MSFEPEYTKINLNSKKGCLCEQIKVDAKTDILCEDISSVLSVSAFPTVMESQAENGEVSYGGRVIFYISYLATDGTLKKCECGAEFKGKIKEPKAEQSHAFITAKTVKTETELSGVRLSVSAYVDVCVELSGTLSIEALSGGENLIVNSGEINYHKGYGKKSLIFPIEEEFELNYPVEEVLNHRAEAIITTVQCGVNCIIVDGEVILSAIMLQKNGRSGIIKETKTLPFRAEIECEDAMPNMQAQAKVVERSFKTDISVDEDNGKSVVQASVSLMFEGEAFADCQVVVATDAFSTEQEVEVVKKALPYFKAGELRSCYQTVVGRCVVSELPVGAVVLAVGSEQAEIIEKRCGGDNTVITGVLYATAYFTSGEGGVFTQRVETPFECALDCGFGCEVEIDTVVRARKAKLKIISLTEVELESELAFSLYPQEKQEINLVCEVKPLGEKQKNTSAISVYIPLEGEELWSLAKRLNVCPQTLIETNSDLQFPLTGKERIVVYRQR